MSNLDARGQAKLLVGLFRDFAELPGPQESRVEVAPLPSGLWNGSLFPGKTFEHENLALRPARRAPVEELSRRLGAG